MRYRHFHYKGTLKAGTLKGILNMEKLFVDLGKKSYDILFSDNFNGFAKAMSDINEKHARRATILFSSRDIA